MKTNKKQQRKLWYSGIVFLIVIAVLGLPRLFEEQGNPTTAPTLGAAENCTLTVSFLDVGQGAATLLRHEDKFVLIDTGDTFAKDALFADLDQAGVTTLDYVVVSHPHSDHMANLDDILDHYTVKHVVLNDMDYDSKMWRSAVALVSEKEIPTMHPMAEDTFALGDVTFTVLNPIEDPNSYGETNDSSIVLKVSHGEDDFMFCGDATVYVENELLYRYKSALDIEVYAVSHHGSYLSNSPQFLAALSPEYSVISVGTDNQYGHPDQETLDRLAAVGGTVYRTDLNGTVVMESSGSGIRAR